MSISDAHAFFETLELRPNATQIADKICSRYAGG
jgi:hypothetical protein